MLRFYDRFSVGVIFVFIEIPDKNIYGHKSESDHKFQIQTCNRILDKQPNQIIVNNDQKEIYSKAEFSTFLKTMKEI